MNSAFERAMAAFFGVDAGIRAGRVDKCEHRELELLGRLHETQGLAVSLRLAHAEVARRAFLRVAALLVADHHARYAVEACETAHDRQVIRKMPVAVKLDEIGEDLVDVVERVGTLRMPCDLGDLPRRQVAVDVLGELLALLAELIDFFRNVDRRFGLHITQFFDLGFEFSNGLLEVEEGSFRQRLLLFISIDCPPARRVIHSGNTVEPALSAAGAARERVGEATRGARSLGCC